MRHDLLPVLWVTGPPGVGKTTVSWELFSKLTKAGSAAAYVDIDQLGICRPDPPHDPGRYRTQARNLGAILANFQAAGARCAVVSGVIDPERGVYPDVTERAAVTLCRLRAGPDELRRRFLQRRGDPSLVDDVLRSAHALDVSRVAALYVETTRLSVDQVVRLVGDVSQGWNRLSPSSAPPAATQDAPAPARSAGTRVLWLYGVTGAGKSTVGFELFLRAARVGRRTAYVDLRQVGFCRPAPAGDPRNHRVRAWNAAALWRTYRAAGVQDLVLTGPAESQYVVDQYRAALESGSITICRLHAGADALRDRILLRGQGGSWPEPGDPLKGRSTACLRRIADEAAAESEALDRAGVEGLRVATDDLTAEQTAVAVAAAAGWPEERS